VSVLLGRTQDAISLLARGHPRVVLEHALSLRLHSQTLSLGLRRDLDKPHVTPAAKVPLEVRPLAKGDDLSLLDIDQSGLASAVVFERLVQQRLIAAELPTCWVAIGPDRRVCYMQWLVAPHDNARVYARWGDLLPPLGRDEALVEGVYTGDAYRGQGIMGHALSRIAEAARDFGARWTNAFVGRSNIASLKGFKTAGFVPYVERSETWRLLRRRVRFTPLPEGTA
jgi:GNAT superfamily N-acetyltransferase